MSFLNDLCNRRKTLKSTTTLITCIDGRKFKECSSSLVEVEGALFGFVVDTKPDNVPAKVVDHLYLGAQDCCDIKVMTDYEISYVLSVGIEAPLKYDGITYKFVQCLDLEEACLGEVLKESVDFITEGRDRQCNVLVHCNAGVSRSASVVIGYLILVCHFGYSDAFDIVKSARSCIRPNDGFIKQLKKLNNTIVS